MKPELENRLNQAADIMGEYLAKHFIDLGGLGLTADVPAEGFVVELKQGGCSKELLKAS